mgnify:CR=1 FL=1
MGGDVVVKGTLRLLLVLVSTPVVAGGDVELIQAIQDMLERHPVMAGEFTQELHVEALSRPVSSQGRLYLLEDGGVAWYVDTPVTTSVFIDASGNTRMGTGYATPDLKWVTDITRALIAGDFDYLSRFFEVKGRVAGRGWSVELTPVGESLASALERIVAQGGSVVESLEVLTAAGDTVMLYFSNVNAVDVLPDAVSADMRALPE